jgi:SAM-dependent methyltransferase
LNLWGTCGGIELSSGAGSEESTITDPYIESIHKWANENQAKNLHALDLGCGDFRVVRRIFHLFNKYTAVDIVPKLISKHSQEFSNLGLNFICLDAIEEDLPDADVVFIRQVLQHLSNSQIQSILPKLVKYKHLIITEHLPPSSKISSKNMDKVHGGGIRLNYNSGIYLDTPPFFLKFIKSKIITEVPAGSNKERDGIIVTTWYQLI